ncbi:LysM peptidoglycan-binding domain-containing protein [Labilibacter sediminis]|nr:LysM peptidoglycan-binding domain-containing protein [Labilibacter sediminis]
MGNKLQLSFLVIGILFSGFLLNAQTKITKDQYISKYSELAVKEMKRVGIPASITLAQGMLESGNGNSNLARRSNNHFGIKCHSDWNGKKVYHDDDRKGECFRKYKNVYDSYIDHSDFLTGKTRYASLFELKTTDYKGWAKGLKKAGYATDPKYAHRLIHIIEENDLERFDSGVKVKHTASKPVVKETRRGSKTDNFTIDAFGSHKVEQNNGVKYIKVNPDDSFSSVCTEFGLKEWEIFAYNDLEQNANIQKYKYLYVQPKRSKAHRKHTSHKLKQGETLHYLSQKYGVKISRLYKYNGLKKGDKVKDGQVIQLRKKKK